MPVAAQAQRVASGGGQADRRPGRVELAARLPRRRPEAAVGVLRAGEEGDLVGDVEAGRRGAAPLRRCRCDRALAAGAEEPRTTDTAAPAITSRATPAAAPSVAPRRRGGRLAAPSGAEPSQLTSMRTRIRASTRASSGAKARPKRKLATVSVTSKASAWPETARNAAGVWLAPSVQV